jgi:hypothetical protein
MKIQLVGEGDEASDEVYERLNFLKKEGKITGMLEYIKNLGPIRDRGLYHNLAIIIDDNFMISVIPETNEELLKQIEKYK